MTPAGGVPRVVTERLVLRGFGPGDVDVYAALMADPGVVRHLGDGRPLSRVDAWRQLAIVVGHWTLRGFGLWAAEERATGAFVGRVGCYEPEGWPACEVGYALARPYWGRGYALEGARASLRYAHEVLGRARVVSLVRPGNARSARVAERLGARAEGTVEVAGAPATVYAYPPPA